MCLNTSHRSYSKISIMQLFPAAMILLSYISISTWDPFFLHLKLVRGVGILISRSAPHLYFSRTVRTVCTSFFVPAVRLEPFCCADWAGSVWARRRPSMAWFRWRKGIIKRGKLQCPKEETSQVGWPSRRRWALL
jgi:hypothetical protein